MNLLRLLTTGRSWVGTHDKAPRYHMRPENLLPKFGSKKNPFASSVQAAPSAITLPAPAVEGKLETKALFDSQQPAAVPTAPPARRSVKAVKSTAIPEIPVVPKPAESTVTPVKQVKATPEGGWFKMLNPFSYFGGGQPTGSSRPARSQSRDGAVQAELSLDRVRVVRNDLSDADLEIVPGKLMGLPSGASPVLARESRVEQGAWGRLTSKFMGAEHAETQ